MITRLKVRIVTSGEMFFYIQYLGCYLKVMQMYLLQSWYNGTKYLCALIQLYKLCIPTLQVSQHC